MTGDPAAALRTGRLAVFLVLSLALLSVAHGAIFVRLADAHPLVIAAFRMAIATLVLLPFALPGLRAALPRIDRIQAVRLVGAVLFLTLHFATWIASLDHTSIANAVLLVTLTPVWLALWTVIVRRVHPGRHTLGAVGLAVAGSVVIGSGSLQLGGSTLYGDFLAFIGGFFFAGYFLLAQNLRRSFDLLPYVTLVYGGSAVLLWLLVLALALPVTGLSSETYVAMAAIALVSQVIGHSGLNWAVRTVPPTFLALTILAEPLLSTLFGWLYFAEGFGTETAIGGVLVLAGIWLGARASMPRKPPKTA